MIYGGWVGWWVGGWVGGRPCICTGKLLSCQKVANSHCICICTIALLCTASASALHHRVFAPRLIPMGSKGTAAVRSLWRREPMPVRKVVDRSRTETPSPERSSGWGMSRTNCPPKPPPPQPVPHRPATATAKALAPPATTPKSGGKAWGVATPPAPVAQPMQTLQLHVPLPSLQLLALHIIAP